MPMQLNNLGISFHSRFDHTGNLADISEAISNQQRAVQLTPNGDPRMPMWLSNLGSSFQSRFERTGDLSDLSEAIANKQRAIQLTPVRHPHLPRPLNALGNSFRRRFDRTGDLSDLSEAISNQKRAVQLTPDGHPDMPKWLNNLGLSLQRRFGRTGDVSDLSEAISNQQRAVQLTSDGHPDKLVWFHNLGIPFQTRFEYTNNLSDLTEAITNMQQTIQLIPDGHPHMARPLDNLGNAFWRRFERTRNPSDLSEAISNQKRAIQLTPDGHPEMAGRLNNLGLSFHSRFQHTGDLSDLSEAITNQQQAVQLCSDGHPNMPERLGNLGNSFYSRFERTDNLSDLLEAITNQQRAIQLTPDGHPNMSMWLKNLANSFHSRFHSTHDLADIHAAASTYQKSATSLGPPSARFQAAQKWAELSMAHDLPHSLTAYGIAIDLISEIAGMDSTIMQRHTHLIDISTLTTSAVAAAFAHGEAKKALEWLEQGRCLVWSQLNQLRSSLNDLHVHDEHLAQRFSNISSALETSGSRRGLEGMSIDAPLSEKISLQDEAHIHIKLSREWSELLNKIRNIPQFNNFLQPSQASDLLKYLPQDGIVILVNVHKFRCDALALISGSDVPIHIPLTDFTHKEASDLRERLHRFLSNNNVRMREVDRGVRPAPRSDAEKHSGIHFVLGALWVRVVRPILDGLGFSVSFSRFFVYYFVDILFQVYTTGTIRYRPNLVVSNSISSISSPPRRGNLWSEWAVSSWFLHFRLCNFLVYTYCQLPAPEAQSIRQYATACIIKTSHYQPTKHPTLLSYPCHHRGNEFHLANSQDL